MLVNIIVLGLIYGFVIFCLVKDALDFFSVRSGPRPRRQSKEPAN